MRELKFRAYDGEIEEFYYSNNTDYCTHEEDKEVRFIFVGNHIVANVYIQENTPVVTKSAYVITKIDQYTNKLDSNKREIYENDIVELEGVVLGDERNLTGIVKFIEQGYFIDTGKELVNLFDETAKISILKNIYENSELLEG